MGLWSKALLANFVSLCVAACGSLQDAPYISPPDLMDQLANANLSAPPPLDSTGALGGATSPVRGKPQNETYIGDEFSTVARPQSHPPKGISSAKEGYDLNFSDAELAEVTKVILGDTLQVTYLFDPRVEGRVTLSTGGPVSRPQLLVILEQILNVHRSALLIDGNVYKIMPQEEAQQQAFMAFDYVRERNEIGPGYGVSIFPLRYASSETMMRMLNSLGPTPDTVRAGVQNNLLIVRGTAQERQALLGIATTFDVDWMRGQSAGIFSLRDAAADDVVKELQKVFQADGQGKSLIRFETIKRINAVLVLTQKADLLEQAEEWVLRLDRGGEEGDNYYVYRVENGRAADLAAVLKATFGASGATVGTSEQNEVSPTESASLLSSSTSSRGLGVLGGEQGQASLGSQASATESSFSTDGAGPAQLAASSLGGETSGGAGSSDVRIVADERNNKLLIKASAREYRKILSLLKKVDQPALQVLINATLAEVTLNDNLQYGVQFFLQKNSGSAGLLGFTNGTEINIGSAVPGLNFVVGSIANNPKVILDALAGETSVRVVSSPSVVVLHNQTATLQVGDEVPIATRQATSVINPDAPLVNEIEFKNTGVILKVTPRINSNGLVSMEVEQEISAVSSTNAVGDSGTLTPTISQRRIKSMIAVQSGQMVVLGGLIGERNNQEKSSIPLFGKIPYIGDVIGGKTSKTMSRTELVVFLRPVVIRDPHDASRVAESVRAAMQSLAPRPSAWDADLAARGSGDQGDKRFK